MTESEASSMELPAKRVIICAIGGTLFALAVGAVEITKLPEGPNRDLVSKVCQSCHDLQTVFDGAGFSRLGHDARRNDRERHERFAG
jgi:hypothetical protein